MKLLIILLTFFLIPIEVFADSMPIVCGHRGASHLACENTLPAFQKCLDLHIPAIELDVHQCKSGQIVVIHDDTVDRTTNGKGLVNDLNWENLAKLNIKANHFKDMPKIKLPLLSQVLDLISGKLIINIEIKGYTPSLVQGVLNNLKHYPDNSKIIISSFEYDALKEVYKLNPHLKLAVLTEHQHFADVEDKLAQIKAVSWNPDFETVNASDVVACHNQHYQVWVWTIDSLADYQKALDLKVDAIITNEPDKLIKFLQKLN